MRYREAVPHQSAEARMDRLEAVLTTFIRHTDETIAELRLDIAEMRQWRVQAQKQWGEIAQKMGTFVEDIEAPNIPYIARTVFGLGGQGDELMAAPRVRVWHPADPSKVREFDYIYATRRGWIVVESRNSPKLNDIDQFRELLAEVRDYFPQYAASPLRPIFASLYVPEQVVKYCTRQAIYALGMGRKPCSS